MQGPGDVEADRGDRQVPAIGGLPQEDESTMAHGED